MIQVDSGLHLEKASINRRIGEDAAIAAEILIRLSPFPSGPPHLETFHKMFIARYNEGREVPLLELLDADMGIGPYPPHTADGVTLSPSAKSRRNLLMRLACECIRKQQRVLNLDDTLIGLLQTSTPTGASWPTTLDLFVQIAAKSADEIDRENYLLVIGPSVGSIGAGRGFARFGHIHGERSTTVVTELSQLDDALHPNVIAADLVFQPRVAKLANVILRPTHHSYRIDWGGHSDSPNTTLIPPSELTVVAKDGQLRVKWKRMGTEIRVSNGHLLNMTNAPSVAQFLSEVAGSGVTQIYGFSWGVADNFPFLPRVQYGRIVLRPAEWRVPRALLLSRDASIRRHEARAAFAEWARDWFLPRTIYLTYGDNRLLLNLDDSHQELEVFRAAARSDDAEHLVLQEALPSAEEAWVTGSDGHYMSELVIPLKLRQAPPVRISNACDFGISLTPDNRVCQPYSRNNNITKIPSSEWVYAKLYMSSEVQEDFIVGSLRPFVESVFGEQEALQWFFIRYADPDTHFRIRFSGPPSILAHRLLPRLFEWVAEMPIELLARFCIDTYDREVERYGGITGISLAESIFHADSNAVVNYIACQRTKIVDASREEVGLATVDNLLAGLGLNEDKRIDWLANAVKLTKEDGTIYRARQPALRELVSASRNATSSTRSVWSGVLEEARVALEPHGTQLATAPELGMLSISAEQFLGSIVHMHLNRLLGPDRETERRVLALLLRTSRSLREICR